MRSLTLSLVVASLIVAQAVMTYQQEESTTDAVATDEEGQTNPHVAAMEKAKSSFSGFADKAIDAAKNMGGRKKRGAEGEHSNPMKDAAEKAINAAKEKMNGRKRRGAEGDETTDEDSSESLSVSEEFGEYDVTNSQAVDRKKRQAEEASDVAKENGQENKWKGKGGKNEKDKKDKKNKKYKKNKKNMKDKDSDDSESTNAERKKREAQSFPSFTSGSIENSQGGSTEASATRKKRLVHYDVREIYEQKFTVL